MALFGQSGGSRRGRLSEVYRPHRKPGIDCLAKRHAEYDASLRLSAQAQASHQVVGSPIDGAPNAYVIQVIIAQQI